MSRAPLGVNADCRLVKKLPGQPPSGAIVPSADPSEPPNVIAQVPAPGAVRNQRPAMSSTGPARPTPADPSGAAVTLPVGAAIGAVAAGGASLGSLKRLLAQLASTPSPASAAAPLHHQHRTPKATCMGSARLRPSHVI